MKQFLFIATLVLMANVAHAQYNTNYTYSIVDITSYATSGTNAWKYMAGNPVCAPNSLAIGSANSRIWCVGAAGGPPYRFNVQTKSWDAQSQMGIAPAKLVVVDGATIYSLQPTPTCGWNYGGSGRQSYDLFYWNTTSSAWTQPHPNSCMFQASADSKGNLTVIGWDGVTHVTALFTSTDGGATYALWSDSWQYVNMWEPDMGCAVNNAGIVYWVSTSDPAVQLPSLPSGAAVGCMMVQDDPAIMAWSSSGNVYFLNEGSPPTWSTVAGLSVTQIVGTSKSMILALDSSGKPYHWNVWAPYISGNTTGKWPNCSAPGNVCNSSAVHTSYLQVNFASGHGINAGAGVQHTSIPATGTMNVSSWDINPACDPLLGHPDDPECTSNTYGYNHCSQTNQALPDPPPASSKGMSIDVIGFAGAKGFSGPIQWGTDYLGRWSGTTQINVYERCPGVSVATCPGSSPLSSSFYCAYLNASGGVRCYASVKTRMLDRLGGVGQPWVVMEPYVVIRGQTQCSGTTGPLIPYGADTFALPDCQ